MAENESQGISRRDLLKRGAALGGAVVWATPVVQTLGMGRAFAQTASPADVSYVALWWDCEGDGIYFFAKTEDNGTELGLWEPDPGKAPGCSTPQDVVDNSIEIQKVDGTEYFDVYWSGGCAYLTNNTGCDVHYVAKGGQDPCQTGILSAGAIEQQICM